MNPLSKEARDALETLDGNEPTAADERRVRQQLERSLGVIIPVATVAAATMATTAAASTAAASTGAASSATAGLTSLGVGAKVVLFVAAVSVGSLVTVGAKAVITPTSAPRSVKQRVPVVAPPPPVVVVTPVVQVEVVAVVAPPEPEPEVMAPPPVVTIAPKPSPSRPVARPSENDAPEIAPVVEVASTPEIAPPAPKAPPSTEEEFDVEVEVNFPSCDAPTELRSALAARRLLMEKHAEHALWLLSAYQKRCASGRWSDEAWRVRLASLCTLGRNREATSLLEWFTSEYPTRRPAIEAMLRGSCAPEVLGE